MFKEFQLESDSIKVTITELGAEIVSIYDKEKNEELLWNGDSKFWTGQAPVLFPFVGRLKNNEYQYNGQTYQMNQHGFARKSKFGLLTHSENSISFSLKSNDDTKKIYPFDFELILFYELNDRILNHTYTVKNTGLDVMYYSIGGHPAFALNKPFHEYSLEFNKKEPNLKRTKLKNSFLSNKEVVSLEDDVIIPLNYNLFENDAIVLESLDSKEVSIYHKNEKKLTMNFNGFPFFGIWTKPNAPFLCLEPWQGIADIENSNGNLLDKKGILTLGSEMVNQFNYSVEFF